MAMMERGLVLGVGIDWAEEFHDICFKNRRYDKRSVLRRRGFGLQQSTAAVEAQSGSNKLHQACDERMRLIAPCCAQFTPKRSRSGCIDIATVSYTRPLDA